MNRHRSSKSIALLVLFSGLSASPVRADLITSARSA